MLQDLAALAPSAIVCAVFLIGVGMLLRRELAPKRRVSAKGDRPVDERDDGSES
jgi:hypothetical protein